MPNEDFKALTLRLYETIGEVLRTGDIVRLDELLAPDMIDHTLPSGAMIGREPGKQLIASFARAFPDTTLTVDLMVAEADLVAAYVSYQSTHSGPFLGQAPTGKVVRVTGMDIMRYRDGQVVELWNQFDDLGLLRQFGTCYRAGGRRIGGIACGDCRHKERVLKSRKQNRGAGERTKYVGRSTAGFPGWEERYQQQAVETMPWFYPELDDDLRQALDSSGCAVAARSTWHRAGHAGDAACPPWFRCDGDRYFRSRHPACAREGGGTGAYHQLAAGRYSVHPADRAVRSDLRPGVLSCPAARAATDYVATVAGLLKPGGSFFLKCFSHLQPGTQGPNRFTPEQIQCDLQQPARGALSQRDRLPGHARSAPTSAVLCDAAKCRHRLESEALMSDDVPYWAGVREDLLVQVEHLHPDDRCQIVKALVAEADSAQLAPALAGLIKGYVDRQGDQRESEREAPVVPIAA